MSLERAASLAIRGVLAWVALCLGLRLAGDVALIISTGSASHMSVGDTLVTPLRWVTNPLEPGSIVGEYSAQANGVLWLMLLIGAAGFTWVTLLRHGYANPLRWGKDSDDVPLAQQLRPRLRKLGIWTPHDAARGSDKARWTDKVEVAVLKKVAPGRDLGQMLTRRSNGMLVPYDGAQPDARILLGHHRHLHIIRRKKYNVYARPEQHVAIFGPSGAGKGATQMNPSLLFWNGQTEGSPDGWGKGWPGSIITSTVKADHVDAALEWRMSLSEQCYVYDPLQSYPEFRDFWVGWDPLCTITNFSEANAVAAALMESEGQQSGASTGNEDYFKAQALMVLSPMLLSAAKKSLPFRTVYEWSLKLEAEATNPSVVSEDGNVNPDSMLYAVMDPLYDYAEQAGDDTPLNQMQQVFTKDPREASGVWGSVRKILQPYNDEKSVMSTDARTMPRMLNPRDFYSTPHSTLFIIAPEVANESKRMRPVFAAFITWLIEEAQKLSRENNGKLPHPALANLDEVKNVGAIPGLAHTLSLTRSIGFFVKHAWQDEAQIASAYGKDDAKTITSNSRTWVILPGISDPDHLEALARLIGERNVKKRKKRNNKEAPLQDETTKIRATASMIKEVKDDELLIITDNLPPFVIKATRYFQDKTMLARYQMGDGRRRGEPTPVLRKTDARDLHSTGTREDLAQTLGQRALTQTMGENVQDPPTHQAPIPRSGDLGGPRRTLPAAQDLFAGALAPQDTPVPAPPLPPPPAQTQAAEVSRGERGPLGEEEIRHRIERLRELARTAAQEKDLYDAQAQPQDRDARVAAELEERATSSTGGAAYAREEATVPGQHPWLHDSGPETTTEVEQAPPPLREAPSSAADMWQAPESKPAAGSGPSPAQEGTVPTALTEQGRDSAAPVQHEEVASAPYGSVPPSRADAHDRGAPAGVPAVGDESGHQARAVPRLEIPRLTTPAAAARVTCPDCGRPFSTTGMTQAQAEDLLRMHQESKHPDRGISVS